MIAEGSLAMASLPLYRRIADHYLAAIESGTLAVGDRVPSLRTLMGSHKVSLSTALQACQYLESKGWLEARPRSGYFVRRPRRSAVMPVAEPSIVLPPDASDYVGIHARVSAILARSQMHAVRTNLASAVCAPELYPAETLRNHAIRAMRRSPGLITDPATARSGASFRTALARRALGSGMQAAADDVIVTYGCTEALNLALRAVAGPGDLVAVESPTYYGLLQILESLGMRTLEIPTSPRTGISLEALELAFRTHDIAAVVAMPNLQNPLGCSMSDADKERLVLLCEVHGKPLIEDDTFAAMTSGAATPAAAKAWDRSGNVIHCASLDKILAPGLRLGWMLAGRWQARVRMLKYAQSHPTIDWTQSVAAEFMNSGAFDRHLRRLRAHLDSQRDRTAEAIATYFPEGTRLSVPDGGLLLWVELPGRLSSELLFDAALSEGIRIAPGLMFSNSNRFDHFIRINCGSPYTPAIDAALRRLGALALQLAASGKLPEIRRGSDGRPRPRPARRPEMQETPD
jgi:DNA-binding transcriptional MocR family regulator